jgi:hypothetical protein
MNHGILMIVTTLGLAGFWATDCENRLVGEDRFRRGNIEVGSLCDPGDPCGYSQGDTRFARSKNKIRVQKRLN